MHRKIFFRPERCMTCLSCVLACQIKSLEVREGGKASLSQLPVGKISITFSHGTPWPWVCRHCASAPCVEACVSGSLVQREGQAGVDHHSETCVGCGSCLLACPFSAITYRNDEDRMTKCNLCSEEKIPPCVAACQSKALVYRAPDLFASEKKRDFAREARKVRDGV